MNSHSFGFGEIQCEEGDEGADVHQQGEDTQHVEGGHEVDTIQLGQLELTVRDLMCEMSLSGVTSVQILGALFVQASGSDTGARLSSTRWRGASTG